MNGEKHPIVHICTAMSFDHHLHFQLLCLVAHGFP